MKGLIFRKMLRNVKVYARVRIRRKEVKQHGKNKSVI